MLVVGSQTKLTTSTAPLLCKSRKKKKNSILFGLFSPLIFKLSLTYSGLVEGSVKGLEVFIPLSA